MIVEGSSRDIKVACVPDFRGANYPILRVSCSALRSRVITTQKQDSYVLAKEKKKTRILNILIPASEVSFSMSIRFGRSGNAPSTPSDLMTTYTNSFSQGMVTTARRSWKQRTTTGAKLQISTNVEKFRTGWRSEIIVSFFSSPFACPSKKKY